MNELETQRLVSSLIEEYQEKNGLIETSIAAFEDAKKAVELAGCVGGAFVGPVLNGHVYIGASSMRANLLKSGWKAIYNLLSIAKIAPARDKSQFERSLENPPELTMDNVRATFGDYLLNPRDHILRGLAEAFVCLDPAYKSHSKVKIGVKGLPKRVIIANAATRWGGGAERLKDMINALQVLRNLPLVTHQQLMRDVYGEEVKYGKDEVPDPVIRGLEFQIFANGNVHVFFDADTCFEINQGLAEYYGDILPDVEPGEDQKKAASTAVSKDLQFYATPDKVAEHMLATIHISKGEKVLEPSCGEGALMHHVPTHASLIGYEYDPSRAAKARGFGYNVITANFLEVPPSPEFDIIVMNPPFFGQHYLKHINHAVKFLAPGGRLASILPASAYYDHGKLPDGGRWSDLPVGSFASCGTKVPTGIWYYSKPRSA